MAAAIIVARWGEQAEGRTFGSGVASLDTSLACCMLALVALAAISAHICLRRSAQKKKSMVVKDESNRAKGDDHSHANRARQEQVDVRKNWSTTRPPVTTAAHPL